MKNTSPFSGPSSLGRRFFKAGLACAAAAGLLTASGAQQRVRGGDPFIHLENGTYYLYFSSGDTVGLTVYTSTDLKEWLPDQGRDKFGRAYVNGNGFGSRLFWAPEMHKYKGKYYLFHSAEEKVTVDVGDSPLGPFRNPEKKPFFPEGNIDNSFFLDDDGTPYMLYAHFYAGNEVWICELEKDLLHAKPETQRKLIRAEEDWEMNRADPRFAKWSIAEGPCLVKKDGLYWLTYSSHHVIDDNYNVCLATATSVKGPYVKQGKGPILAPRGRYKCTGHHSLFKDKDGNWKIVFHSRDPGGGPRYTYTADVTFTTKDVHPWIDVGEFQPCYIKNPVPPAPKAGSLDGARLAGVVAALPERPAADGAPASDRAKWDPLAATKEGKTTIRNAERINGEPVPDTPDDLYLEFSRNGNRTNYQKCYFRRKANFAWLYVGECLERKGRFIPKIVAYMDAFCAMKSWTLPAHDTKLTCFNGTPHIDLASAELSRELAFCLSWLGDAIPAATREKVYSEIDRRTFQPYLAHARGERKIGEHWWLHGGNNWNSVCNCCVVRAALAIVPDRRLRAEFVLHAEGSVPYALAGYTDDGYCSEGMGYWNYGYGHHLTMGLSLRAATGGKVDLFANPKTKTVMKYAYGFQLQSGRSPHFADGGGNPSPVLLALGRQIWPDLVSTAALKSPAFGFDTAQFSLRAFGQEPAPCAPTMDVLPARTWFPNAQVLISRRSNNDKKLDWSVAIKGGHNAELHNHNDVGSYAIMMDGVEMCGDPGGEVYTRRTFSKDRYVSKMLNSYGHPVPVVGGRLQKGGRTAAAKVLKTEFTDAKDEIALDYTSAYAVPALKSLVRTMTFDRSNARITITDAVAFSAPTSFEVPVITYREWTANADFTEFVFSKSPTTHRKMKMAVKASAPVAFTKELIDNPGKPSPQRLAFAFKEPVTAATFTTVYSTR